jgi:hypothetical protein
MKAKLPINLPQLDIDVDVHEIAGDVTYKYVVNDSGSTGYFRVPLGHVIEDGLSTFAMCRMLEKIGERDHAGSEEAQDRILTWLEYMVSPEMYNSCNIQ